MTTRERALRSYGIYAKGRNEKGLSDYAVARLTGIRASTISDWKRGLYTPKHDKLVVLSRVIDIPVSYLEG